MLAVLEGRTEPITLTDLSWALGIGRREVEHAVQELRLSGRPVVSGGSGVRLARDATEALACAARLRTRALTQMATARALRDAGRRLEAQEAAQGRLTLWGAR